MTNFLYLGNLIPEKGVIILLDACDVLQQQGVDYRCHIVGAGTRELSVEACMAIVEKKGLSDFVKVHGPLYGADKEKMWQRCDCFVFPTYYHNECFPLVVLEAMQHSLSVIATPVGAIPDMVIKGKSGIIVPVNDTQSLANKMYELIQLPDLAAEMGRLGKLRYEELFTSSHFEERLLSILSE